MGARLRLPPHAKLQCATLARNGRWLAVSDADELYLYRLDVVNGAPRPKRVNVLKHPGDAAPDADENGGKT